MPRHYTPRVECVCEMCGTSFAIRPALLQWKRGRFCSLACKHAFQRRPESVAAFAEWIDLRKAGAAHPSWQGGSILTSDGYVRINIAPGKYQLEHRMVMEQHLGRPLNADEEVHHHDKNRTNNDIANLELMSKAEHARLHGGRMGQWSRDYEFCVVCGGRDRPHGGNGECMRCKARRRYQERKRERA